MKKRKTSRQGDGMRAEYNFSRGVRGKHAVEYAAGTNIAVLAPDVASEFPTDEDVNDTLRAVAKLLNRRKSRSKRAMK